MVSQAIDWRKRMQFRARELLPYVEHVPVDELKHGSVYYVVSFMDDNMLIPELTPLVYVGRDLEPGDAGKVYFQDYDSFAEGYRYPHQHPPGTSGDAVFNCFLVAQSSGVCEFEEALNVLLRCSPAAQAVLVMGNRRSAADRHAMLAAH